MNNLENILEFFLIIKNIIIIIIFYKIKYARGNIDLFIFIN